MSSALSILRRSFLRNSAEFLAYLIASRSARAAASGVVTGAIRWDAWYRRTDFSVYAQNDLAPEKFHYRVPLHCKVNSHSIDCNGNQADMDEEIAVAAVSGIKFWAFVWYPSDSSLRIAWNLYQNSQLRHQINWCGIVSTNSWVNAL